MPKHGCEQTSALEMDVVSRTMVDSLESSKVWREDFDGCHRGLLPSSIAFLQQLQQYLLEYFV
jgi:hypothetical protein